MPSNRAFAQARAGRFYRFIDNGRICVYCGVPATTIDHFAPLSVVSAVMDLLDTRSGRFMVPACGQCNGIAGPKIFRSVGAKRRYIQGRLLVKYKRVLAMPNWTEEQIETFGYSMQTFIRNGLASKEWVTQRLQWRNTDNPSAVKIAAIRFKLGALGKRSAPKLASSKLITTSASSLVERSGEKIDPRRITPPQVLAYRRRQAMKKLDSRSALAGGI